MAGPKKKRPVEQKSAGAIEESSDLNMVIAADFEGMNPSESDYHGIQQLLKQLFLKAHINLGQLSDMIIAQQGLGSVLKQSMDDDVEDDDDDDNPNDVFGVTTVLNLTANKDNECVAQLLDIVEELVGKHGDHKLQETFRNILNVDEKKIGLLINERFINIPAKIADPLMDTLNQELNRIVQKNPSYNFDYYLMICKTYKQLDKDKKDEGMVFLNPEEEVFSKASDALVEFNVSNESDVGVGGLWTEDDKQMIPHRRILLIRASTLPEIIQNVKSFVA